MNTIYDEKVTNLAELVSESANKYGDMPAYKWKNKKDVIEKSFCDLMKDSEAVSKTLNSFGMKDAHVAIVGTSSYEWICTFFGVTGAGAVAVPIDPLLPADDICDLINRADVKIVVFDEIRKDIIPSVKSQCSAVEKIVSMQGLSEGVLSFWEVVSNHYNGLLTTERCIDRNQLCTILFTSGTTGKSKGVMLSHRNLVDNATCMDMGIEPGTVTLSVLPINHVYCLTMDIIKGLYNGVTVCINDSIMHLQKNLALFKPDITLMVPLMIQSIYKKLKGADPSIPKMDVAKAALGGNLKKIYSGGAYLDQMYIDEFKKYGIDIFQGYGMSECSPVISTNKEDDIVKGSVGALIPNCQGKIVDEEIWVKGSSVMLGYYKMPEETKDTITADGWLKTGDLGVIDENGHVFITGRKKNLIILSNGENVSPEELENLFTTEDVIQEMIVRANEGAIEAVVFPNADFVKENEISDVNEYLQKIIDSVNEKQPVYKRITKLTVRDTEFVKTTSKKIKRY